MTRPSASTEGRHPRVPIPPARWPTRAEAQASLLFSARALGSKQARTRCWVPAMVPWRASAEGFVTEDVLAWYGRFADGRPAVLVVEATGIRDVPSGPLLRIGHDRFLPGLERLVECVRQRSGGRTLLLLQILDFLAIKRRPTKARYLAEFLRLEPRHRLALAERSGDASLAEASAAQVRAALAALPHAQLLELLDEREREALEYGYRERVDDLALGHIRELPQVLPGLFAQAAARARKAGFDGVELHFAHAYTMASFLSRTNRREDGYGNSLAGRLRLPLEVAAAVRSAVGVDYTLGCRYLGDEVISAGNRVEDAIAIGLALARAGLDFLSISKGGRFEDARQPRVGEAAYPYTGPSGHECMPTVRIGGAGPFGRNLPLAAAVRSALRQAGLATPVVAAGGINSFELAEAALRRGDCDFIGAARQTLADPDWFRKMELGCGEQVRRCLFTNYCEGLDQKHQSVSCQLWDRQHTPADADGGLRLSQDGKRRLCAPPWHEPDPNPHEELPT